MDNSAGRKPHLHGAVSYSPSDPIPLCCALTRLSRVLATCVPETGMRIDFLRGVCESRAFRIEEIRCRSGDEPS